MSDYRPKHEMNPMTREAFEAMDAADRMAFSLQGGKLIDPPQKKAEAAYVRSRNGRVMIREDFYSLSAKDRAAFVLD